MRHSLYPLDLARSGGAPEQMQGPFFAPYAVALHLAILFVLAGIASCPPANAQTNEWTWMSGSNQGRQSAGVYGQLGVAAPGNSPGGRFGSISWVDADGNFWLFGSQANAFDGNGVSAYLDDVWEYTSNQEWTWVAGTNSVPSGTPNGCLTCAAPPVFGTYQTPAEGNTPGSLQSPIHWIDKTGNLWLFGGIEYNIVGGSYTYETMSALWEFNVANHKWAWMGGSSAVNGVTPAVYGTLGRPDPANTPGGRSGGSGWVDSSGNLWLFGGFGEDSAGTSGYLNDLWMFDTSLNEWTWMGGSNGTFSGPCVAQYQSCSAPGVTGTFQTPAVGNTPQGRSGAMIWTDKSDNTWLFGGETALSYNVGSTSGFEGTFLNDLWKLDSNTHEWAWMSGIGTPSGDAPQYGDSPGVYGTLGAPSATNTPGGRASRNTQSAYTWSDSKGDLWLFSGDGFDSTATVGQLNDLWMFDTTLNEWTWMGGSSTLTPGCITGSMNCSRPGVYGSLGIPSTTNIPGARGSAVQWSDPSGNIWLFGGRGTDSFGVWGDLNDLWEFNPLTDEWKWVEGSNTVPNDGSHADGQFGKYGELRVSAATNAPGGRSAAGSWIDSSGNLWVFGGEGCSSDFCHGWVNDLWRYAVVPPAVATPILSLASGTYTSLQTLTLSDQTPGATIYFTTDGTTPTTSSSVYSAPITVSSSETIEAIAAENGYANSSVASADYTIVLPVAAAPTFNPAGGTYSGSQIVSLSDATAGATIYFTTDGTTPTTGSAVYSSPIAVSSSETIRAIAAASGYTQSSVASAAYTIVLPVAAAPTFNPAGGTYSGSQTVTLSDATAGATIYFTTDSTTPTAGSAVYSSPIAVSSSETIRAIAAASGYTQSSVASAAYTIVLPVAATPTFNPAGGTYSGSQTVTLSDATAGATIYFTTDGTAPTTGSAVYSSPITVSSSETIQAIAAASGYTQSSVAFAAYTINLPPPTFTLAASPTSLTVKSGSPASTVLTITPQNGFNAAVSFACTGMPANVSCSFNPDTVTPSGAAVSTQATLTVGAQASLVHPQSPPFRLAAGWAMAVLLLFFSRRWRRYSRTLLAMLVLLGFGLAISACGGGAKSVGGGGSSQSYTVKFTATSGTIQQTATVTLIEK